jgi:hypothetical protein
MLLAQLNRCDYRDGCFVSKAILDARDGASCKTVPFGALDAVSFLALGTAQVGDKMPVSYSMPDGGVFSAVEAIPVTFS